MYFDSKYNETIVKNKILKLEDKAKRRNLQSIILRVIATVGVMGVALVAPGVLGVMSKFGLLPHDRQKESIITSRNRLIKKGFIEFYEGKLRITERGKIYLIKEGMGVETKNRNRKWDGKWRVLIFDIPKKRRLVRNQIRKALVAIGFMRLQDSVWVYPYDCEDFITLLKADFKIGKDVLYMIVEELEYDKPVRSYFELDRR